MYKLLVGELQRLRVRENFGTAIRVSHKKNLMQLSHVPGSIRGMYFVMPRL